jgi:O-antigen/teichoic acid export membrane protein
MKEVVIMFTRTKKFAIVVLAGLCAGVFVTTVLATTQGQSPAASHIDVLYIGESNGNVPAALALDSESINLTKGIAGDVTAASLGNFDAVVINDINLTVPQVSDLVGWAQTADGSGNYVHGVVVIMGQALTAGNAILQGLGFTTFTTFAPTDPGVKALSVETTAEAGRNHPVVSGITWNAIPEIVNYTKLENFTGTPGNVELVKMHLVDGSSTGNSLMVARNAAGVVGKNLNAIVLAYWLQSAFEGVDLNGQFTESPYFNYMVFGSAVTSTGSSLISYGNWAYSPVPHVMDNIIILIFVVACVIVALVLYSRARAKGRELASQESRMESIGEAEEQKPSAGAGRSITDNPWEQIGFHRQISGFVKMFFLIMFLVIPQLVVSSILMPRFLNPYPQATGWYSFTFRFFEAIWMLFDAGFNFAFAKFFAQHRLERPEKAYHYVQLFVWWQILSGCVQIFLIAFVAGIILPQTTLTYVSWMFVAHSLVQYPGFFLVFQYFFQGMQKADYQMVSFVLREFILRLTAQAIMVPICREIYAGQVMYGAAFGAGIGLILGYQVGDTLLFLMTWGMYRNLGLKSSPIFVAQFTGAEFKETFKFGFKIAVGESLVPLVWLLQVLLVAELLPNASAEQGYFELAWTISQITQAVGLLTASMLGALTEAHEYKKKALLNYTSSSGWKWGNTWNVFLCTALWAIGRTFIIGASGPLWGRAASLLPWLVLFNLLGPISWQGDQEFSAANRPGLAGTAWVIEQSIRAVLLITLLPVFRTMDVVVITYIVSLAIKNIFVLGFIRMKIHKWDWNPWPTFVAPAIAGLCNFGILWFISNMLGQTIIDALLLFGLAMFGMVFLNSFFMGLFGGYDKNTLAELDKATMMVTGVKGLARAYFHMAAAGARISPLHNRFPMKHYEEALKEARELTEIKRDIKGAV